MAAARQPAFPRTIFHVDMDAFFVSVEELYDPSLKGKAVVVGVPRDERGVVSAASYAARKFGVHSAMPLRTAAKMCPQAIFVNGHPERYRECSEKVHTVLGTFSPQVEMASIDEAYLDMTGTERLHGPPLKAAQTLHERMKADTGLNCSVGIGTSRLIAKVSSAQAKPNGVLWIVPGEEAKFLAPLDVREIPGVGKVMETHLHALGIKKVGDLARLEESELGDGGKAATRIAVSRPYHSAQTALQRFHHAHACPHSPCSNSARHRNLRADSCTVPQQLEERRAHSAAGRAGIIVYGAA